MKQHVFAPRGVLALEPQAFGGLFDVIEAASPVTGRDGVAVVSVRGPLQHHAGWLFDSYESIRERVAYALASGPRALVLSIDSPGGMVAGMLEAAQGIRSACASAGVELVAYVDGAALSAAYALACAADRICVPPTGLVGSIGTIDALASEREADAARGLRIEMIASGARKTDGNPKVDISDEARAAAQGRVDALAQRFFEHVAGARGLSVEDVRAMEAGILTGADAVSGRLADEVTTFDALIASLAAGDAGAEDTMDEDEKARAALQAIIDNEDGDEKAKARARKALAAMDESDDEEATAESDEGEDEKKDDEEAKASARGSVSASTAGELATRLTHVERQLEAQQREEILASRPDLSPGLLKVLASKPVAEVKAIVNAIEKPKKPKLGDAAAANAVAGTQGAPAGTGDRQPPEAVAAMDRAMGLTTYKLGAKREGPRLYLGALIPGDQQ